MSQPELPIVLYHYTYSPFAKRLVWYLELRGIPYSQCLQPPILPRPDLAKIGVNYRRIPLLSIGRDVYLDTRLIIQKLEQMYPSRPRLGAATGGDQKAVERLLEVLVVDGGLFRAAAQLIPTTLPILKDPRFLRDRAAFAGGGARMDGREAAALRPEAVNEVRAAMELLETTLLADGRDWLLGTGAGAGGPSLADLEAVWPLHWLVVQMPGALPAGRVSEALFPRVYAWIARFQAAVKAAGQALGKPRTVSGDEAREVILQAAFHDPEGAVDGSDPLVGFHGLAKGTEVAVWPVDTGSSHKDVGRLVSLDGREVVIALGGAGEGIRLHAPRHGFRVRPAPVASASL